MNVYTWEMKRNIKTTIVWMVALVLVQLMYISVYPSMVKDTELLTRMMKLMPKAFLRIFGLEDLDFSNILNYQASISSIYVTLVGSIFAVLLTCKVLAKEESEKTAEFLLSKPVKRSNVLLQKISSTLTLILTFDLVICVSSLLMVEFFKQGAVDYTRFWLFWLSQILLHLTVANLVFTIIVLAKRQDSTTSFSIGMTFVLYILAMASKLTEKLELLKYLTPFYYSEGIRIVKYGRMEPVFLVIYFFLNLALFFLRFSFTRKRTFTCEEGGVVHEVVERILKASIEEFSEKGYAAASTNSIAKKAKVSKGLLFHYFKSKENLYIECYKHVLSWSKKKFEEFAKQVRDEDFFEFIKKWGLQKITLAIENPVYSKFLLTVTNLSPKLRRSYWV